MAVALVIFARWDPVRCLLASLLFGGASALGPALQSVGVTSGYYLFNAAPYALTLVIIVADQLARSGADRAAGRAAGGRDERRASTRQYVPGDPYPWPWNGDLRPREHGADRHRHADRLLRQGRLHRSARLRHLAHARLHRADPARARPHARRAAIPSCTRARGTAPISPTCPPTSAGARGRRRATKGVGHRRRGPVRPHPGARRARLGHHPRARAAARRDDHRQAGQGLVLRDRPRSDPAPARDRQHHPHRHHDRRLRAHHHARGQRPRLRVPAAGGLLRRHRRRQPRRGAEDGQDAERRLRRASPARARLLEALP